MATLRVDLVARDDVAARTAALERGREVLASYGLPGKADWSMNKEFNFIRTCGKNKKLYRYLLYGFLINFHN